MGVLGDKVVLYFTRSKGNLLCREVPPKNSLWIRLIPVKDWICQRLLTFSQSRLHSIWSQGCIHETRKQELKDIPKEMNVQRKAYQGSHEGETSSLPTPAPIPKKGAISILHWTLAQIGQRILYEDTPKLRLCACVVSQSHNHSQNAKKKRTIRLHKLCCLIIYIICASEAPIRSQPYLNHQIHLIEETKDLSTGLLATSLLVVHDASRGGQLNNGLEIAQ